MKTEIAKVIDVIENANGDTFIRHANGILEIHFRKYVSFKFYSSLSTVSFLSVAKNIEIPNDIPLIKTISLNATLSTSGQDSFIAGIGDIINDNKTIKTFYVMSYKNDGEFSKDIYFHCTGYWK